MNFTEYTITVPPLRERRSDIEALAARCASRFAQALGKQPKPIAPEAMEALLRYSWPGNVRELETVLERPWPLPKATSSGFPIFTPDLRSRGFRTHRKTAARPRSETPARRARTDGGQCPRSRQTLDISRGARKVELQPPRRIPLAITPSRASGCDRKYASRSFRLMAAMPVSRSSSIIPSP
ncbi:MAG: hypothetical protein ACLR0N_06730 [Bilophila wadsworthia]